MTTGFIFDEAFMSHHTGAGHPECAERLSVTMEHLSALPLYDELKHYEPLPVEQELIEANHSSAYLTRARQTCAGGSAFLDSLDVTVSEESYDVALKAAGATLALAEGVINEEISNGFASTHQYPFYPGTGAWSEMGIGKGRGAKGLETDGRGFIQAVPGAPDILKFGTLVRGAAELLFNIQVQDMLKGP